jgi:simple sugar transport system permease protein
MDILALILALSFSALRLATPLIFSSMGGLLSERSGVVNIALEGFILVGAFSGSIAAHAFASAWVGWIAALICGLIAGAIFAFFVIELKADQIVTGTAINLLAMGVIPFLSKIFFGSTGSTPSILVEDRFTFEPLVMAMILAAFLFYMMRNLRAGLWITFAGEHPEALLASGIHPRKVRWISVMLSGGLAAWGGASLSLYLASAYSPMMSGGRGFMALAALIFGKWKPLPTFLACLFFGLADALQIRLQGAQIAGFEIPVQFIQILPYVVTIITLAGFIGSSRAPKALGNP